MLQPAQETATRAFPIPIDEEARLAALHALKILDTPPDERFDRVLELAKSFFDMPVCRITFVDRERTYFKARIGIQVQQAPRSISICSHTILSPDVLVSKDLSLDPRFCDSPQVTGKPNFRFYAGAPITVEGGQRVGSVCLMDFQPHPEFSEEQADALAKFAAIVEHELELHRQIMEDTKNIDILAEQLDIAQTAKQRFANIVSHELLTPIHAIRGFSEIVADKIASGAADELTPAMPRYVIESASRLQALVQRVLSFVAADGNSFPLSESSVNVSDLLDNAVATATLQAQAASQPQFSIRSASDDIPFVTVDHVHMLEALVQLVQNAITFSPPDQPIEVWVETQRSGDLLISVADRGSSIPEEEIARAMEPFTALDESRQRTHGGLGIGLPLTQALVAAHGGRLSLTQREGGGTVASISLPAYRVHQRH